jgi:hypothetical protein
MPSAKTLDSSFGCISFPWPLFLPLFLRGEPSGELPGLFLPDEVSDSALDCLVGELCLCVFFAGIIARRLFPALQR